MCIYVYFNQNVVAVFKNEDRKKKKAHLTILKIKVTLYYKCCVSYVLWK